MKTNYRKLNSGMSLIEAMIVVAIMSLIFVGLTSLFAGMVERQRLTETNDSILKFSYNLKKILKDEAHWQATVYNASNLANIGISCLRDNTGNCLHNGLATNFDIYLDDGTAFYLSSALTTGITYSGVPCNTYPSAICPLRYNMTLRTQCQDAAPNCTRPQVTLIGNLTKAPGIDNPISRKIDDRQVNTNPPFLPTDTFPNFSFRISRGERSRYEPFELVQYSQVSGAMLTPPASGGGACVPNVWNIRPLSALLYDRGNYVTFNNVADTFSVPPGTYECTITAEGYDQVQGFKIRLSDMTTPSNSRVVGSAITQDNASAVVYGNVKLQLSQPINVLQLEHYCGQASDAIAPINSDMGRPIINYNTNTVFTRVYCVRTQ